MHHPILFGLLFGWLFTRFFLRRRRWAMAHAGGCGARHGFHGRFGRFHRIAWDRGGGDGYDYPPDGWGRRGRRDAPPATTGATAATTTSPTVTGTVSQRLATRLGALELSKRQREEADEVVQTLRGVLGDRFERWTHVDSALAAAGAEPFDRDGVEAAIVALAEPDEHKELIDALEHLHNILTDEQRARLRA